MCEKEDRLSIRNGPHDTREKRNSTGSVPSHLHVISFSHLGGKGKEVDSKGRIILNIREMCGDAIYRRSTGRWNSRKLEGFVTKLTPPEHIPYKIRMNLVTGMTKSTVDDQVPEVRDTHEASQDQAEEATDEKDLKRTEVKPLASAAFSFSSDESEFDEETGHFASMRLRCPLCVPTRKDTYVVPYEADSMYFGQPHAENTCVGCMP